MSTTTRTTRRAFLKTAGAAVAAPYVITTAALGANGRPPASERIVMGGIGIGNRGSYDLSCFLPQPDVQFVAVCDVKAARREAVKKMADKKYGNSDCATYRDLRELLARSDIDAVLIATGPNWHATAAILAARNGKDVYCEKPCTKNIAQSLALGRDVSPHRPRLSGRHATPQSAALRLRRRIGPQRQTRQAANRLCASGGHEFVDERLVHPEPEPPKEQVDWDLYLGPAAWRPFNHAHLDGFNFEKGGGMVGGGVLEWGSHCVDLCQWANNADGTSPVEYHPPENGQLVARYANGVKLVLRNDGWLPLGSCPVRFEGDAGWVETGDCGKLILSSPALLAGRKVAVIDGYPATFHVRDFLDCVKTRGKPLANAEAACYSHITCHAANITLSLGRKMTYDPRKNEFSGDAEANRLRSEAIRDPWRL